MARGPFQGTFVPNSRQTVVTAPDVVVYINGEQELVGCPSCSRTFNLNQYITSVQTDLSVDSSPGSATISLAIPRHSIDDFYFDGNPVITTMMEVEIYAKGYFLVEGVPQYYPIFWGIVTEVTDNYASGEHTVSIHCSDILKWWDICKVAINSAYTAPTGYLGTSIVTNVFAGTNPYDIIFSLAAQSFGDVVVGTGTANALIRESTQRASFDAALSDMMLYWSKRFSKMRSNLVMFGTAGVAVRGDTLFQKYSTKPGLSSKDPIASTAVRDANGGEDSGQMFYDATSSQVAAFKTVYANAGGTDVWQSEYQTKLELANAAKEAIGFEFFMDVTGDLVFKPPFYNLDVLSNKPVSWIQDLDIINWDFSESESEVVTQLTMQGSFGGTGDYGTSEILNPYTSVVDYHLLRKYGWRSHTYNSEFINDPLLNFFHGLDVLDRINSRRHRGSMTIPMRPELRLGVPVYVAPKDQLWYVTGISHSFTFGGQATTSLTLTAKREKFIAPKGTGTLTLDTVSGKAPTGLNKEGGPRTFKYSSRQLSTQGHFTLDATGAATIPAPVSAYGTATGSDSAYEPLILRHPKTGRLVGYPNVVMVYTRPFTAEETRPEQLGQQANQYPVLSKKDQEKARANMQQSLNQQQEQLNSRKNANVLNKHLTNRYQYGLNSAGVFVYAHDASGGNGVISEVLTLPVANLDVTNVSKSSNTDKLALIRPVSDERGFELIGHYQYGRRISLKDGRLVISSGAVTGQPANVSYQLGLAGDLSSILTAQSQGLVSVPPSSEDPAETLQSLTVTDVQTAAVPTQKGARFVSVGDNFIGQSATLGSPAQKGSPSSVEASQLSRALTLAELSVKDESGVTDPDCPCITGRSDLAFMGLGYELKDVSASSSILDEVLSEDADSVVGGSEKEIQDRIATLQDEVIKTTEQYQAAQLAAGHDTTNVAWKQEATDLYRKVQQLSADLAQAEQDLVTYQANNFVSSNPVFGLSHTELVSKVDQYLVNLYQLLDGPHQQLETALRGDLLPTSDASLTETTPVTTPSEFAPPFNAPNRYQLGDVKANIGVIHTNADNISNAWSTFGSNLKDNATKAQLTNQISADQSSITKLTATRNQLQKQKDAHVVVVGADLDKNIKDLDTRIAQLQKQVADNQTKLSTL